MSAETKVDWASRAKSILKAELTRKNVSYRELANRLRAIGVHDTDRNIANKICRGAFTAVFLLQCFEAIDTKLIRLED
jgi:hypothetical protein